MRIRTGLALLTACLLVGLTGAPTPSAASTGDTNGALGGSFEYSIRPLGSDTQSWPTINFLGPYFYFLLRNEASVPDSFSLALQNVTQPTWFPQVCLRAVCFPDSAKVGLNGFAFDTVGVNLVPFTNGLGEADFRVSSVGDPSLFSVFHIRLFAGTAAVDVTPLSGGIASLQLAPSFPNPAQNSARIGFVLPRADRVSLRLFDVMGRQVATLVDGSLPAGAHSVVWSGEFGGGRPAPAGTYFYRLETPEGALSRRLVLLR